MSSLTKFTYVMYLFAPKINYHLRKLKYVPANLAIIFSKISFCMFFEYLLQKVLIFALIYDKFINIIGRIHAGNSFVA